MSYTAGDILMYVCLHEYETYSSVDTRIYALPLVPV